MPPDKGKSRSGGTRRGTRRSSVAPLLPVGKTSPDTGSQASDTSWTIRPASAQADKEWKLAVQAEPDVMSSERDRPRTRPMDRSANPRRTGPLHGALSARTIGGLKLPQWQHELTGAARIWYCPDRASRTVWIVKVDLAHPKETE